MDMAPDPGLKGGTLRPMPSARAELWADLADHAAEPNCFYAPDMLQPALDHLAEAGSVRLLEVFSGGMLIALMPVTVARTHGRLPVRNITNWVHRHCFFGAPLVRRGREQEAWAGLLEQIDGAGWAPHFLHLSALDAAGASAAALEAVCVAQARTLVELQRYDRALLRSDLDAKAYWEAYVRAKKRKELRRLQKRLSDLGAVENRMLEDSNDLGRWCGDFLALEASGWKGREGTALESSPNDAAFFRAATAAAFEAGRLHFLRIDLDGRPIAMLVNFRHGPGAFSFKIAIDEALGRFSPGVLIEIDNLHAVLGDPAIAWMDSCAAADHPMIDSLWAERRSIAQYRVALKGRGVQRVRRATAFAAIGVAERVAEFVRGQ